MFNIVLGILLFLTAISCICTKSNGLAIIAIILCMGNLYFGLAQYTAQQKAIENHISWTLVESTHKFTNVSYDTIVAVYMIAVEKEKDIDEALKMIKPNITQEEINVIIAYSDYEQSKEED